jgi:hypothetical protein
MSVLKYEEKLKELTELAIEARSKSACGSVDAFHFAPEDPKVRKAEEARQAGLRREQLVEKLTAYLNSLKRIKF